MRRVDYDGKVYLLAVTKDRATLPLREGPAYCGFGHDTNEALENAVDRMNLDFDEEGGGIWEMLLEQGDEFSQGFRYETIDDENKPGWGICVWIMVMPANFSFDEYDDYGDSYGGENWA